MKTSKGVIYTLSQIFNGYRRHLAVLAVVGVVGAALEGIGINAIVPLFSFLLGQSDTSPDIITKGTQFIFGVLHLPFTFKFLLGFMAVMFLARAIMLAIFSYIRARVTGSFMFREMSFLLSNTLNARWQFLSGQKAGHVQNTLFWDVRQTTNLLDVLAQFIQSFTGFLIYFLVALTISPKITLVTLVVGFFLLLALRPLVNKTTKFGEERSSVEKDFISFLSEHLSGLKVLKATGVVEKVFYIGRGLLERFRRVHTRSVVMQSIAGTIIQPLSFLFLLGVFSVAYKSPAFNLAAFAAVIYLIQKIFVYLQSTQSTIHSIADHISFASHVLAFKEKLYANKESDTKSGEKFQFENALDLTNVSLFYRPEVPVLEGINLKIKKGEFLALIGPSGGGKTSVADLILRLLEPSSGDITIDSKSVTFFEKEEWHKNIGYVSQDIFMINASVKDNIRFYDDSISEEEIFEASKKAHIYDEVNKLENGFDTVVGDRGVALSVGQRQRVVLARALARKPDILILDEATSALDSESEQAIKKTVEEIRKNMTLVVIAHRISTITNADKVVVLQGGKIAEEGDPKEMLEDPDSYISRMLSLQGSK